MSMLKLKVDASQHDRGRLVAVVHGELDHADVVELCTRACGLIGVGSHELVLDLSAARRRYDSADSRTLAWLQERMRVLGVQLTIRPGDITVTDRSMAGDLDEPSAVGTRADDFTAHCEKPGAPGYRPETADQP
jgi:hypothetical protein